MEEWKIIDGFNGIYSVSNLGRIKNNKRNTIKKLQKHNCGYLRIKLGNKSNYKQYLAHRLVAQYFVRGYSSELEVNHIDCNKKNNISTNLEWCTRKENTAHKKMNGLCRSVKGEKNKNSKLKRSDIKKIFKDRESGMTQQKIAKRYGVSQPVISGILLGKIWIL